MIIQPLPKFEHFENLVKEVQDLISRVPFKDDVNQLALQVKDPLDNSENAWYESCGRISKGNTFIVEPHYKYINPNLAGGFIDKWIGTLEQRVVRTRLMHMNPRTCYSIHSDPFPRIHIPIVTNEQCLMCFPDEGIMQYLPADGSSYFIDTTKRHTFINCSTEIRIHLVCVVVSQ